MCILFTGEQFSGRYVVFVGEHRREVSETSFAVLLELALARLVRPDGWLPIRSLQAAGSDKQVARQQIRRLRNQLKDRLLIENNDVGAYRLAFNDHEIDAVATLWNLTNLDVNITILRDFHNALSRRARRSTVIATHTIDVTRGSHREKNLVAIIQAATPPINCSSRSQVIISLSSVAEASSISNVFTQ